MNKPSAMPYPLLCAVYILSTLFLTPLRAEQQQLPSDFQMAKLAPSAAWKVSITRTASGASNGEKKMLVARRTAKTPGIRTEKETFSDASIWVVWYVHLSERDNHRIFPNPLKQNELDVSLVHDDENRLLAADFPELGWLEPAKDFQEVKTMNGVDFFVFKCPPDVSVASTGSHQELTTREAAAGAVLIVAADSRLPVQFSLAGATWTYDFEAPPAPLVLPQAYRERYEQQIDLGRRVRRQLGFVP